MIASPKWLLSIPWGRFRRAAILGGVPGAIVILAVTWLIGASAATPRLSCEVYPVVHSPDGQGNKFQVVVVRNVGKKCASGVEMRVLVPQSDSMDYHVDTIRKASVSRDNDSLRVALEALPPGSSIVITVRALGAPLTKSSIDVSWNDGALPKDEVRFVHWEDE